MTKPSNARPLVVSKSVVSLIELEVETALMLVWEREFQEGLTDLSFEEWLKSA